MCDGIIRLEFSWKGEEEYATEISAGNLYVFWGSSASGSCVMEPITLLFPGYVLQFRTVSSALLSKIESIFGRHLVLCGHCKILLGGYFTPMVYWLTTPFSGPPQIFAVTIGLLCGKSLPSWNERGLEDRVSARTFCRVFTLYPIVEWPIWL